MAMDLRRSGSRTCRAWLEDTLLTLEGRGVLEALRESRPPHYHVAVFPRQYASYVETIQLASAGGSRDYRVRRGDSLWTIARRHGTTVSELRSANNLRGSRIYAGQVITVP
jgi:nucleoid-associated protein YgaU